MRTTILATLALALSACGDPLFFAELEDEGICMTLQGEPIPAAPAGIGERTVTWEGSFDLGSGIPGLGEKGTTGTIKMRSLTVKSTTDMTSITRAEVQLGDAAGQLTPFMHYAQQPPVADPYTISMTLDQDLDLFDRLGDSGRLGYAIQFTGSPPIEAWSADIVFCMSAKVMVDPFEAMGK